MRYANINIEPRIKFIFCGYDLENESDTCLITLKVNKMSHIGNNIFISLFVER